MGGSREAPPRPRAIRWVAPTARPVVASEPRSRSPERQPISAEQIGFGALGHGGSARRSLASDRSHEPPSCDWSQSTESLTGPTLRPTLGRGVNDGETHHVVEPQDLGLLVAFANDICAATRRRTNWIHMPVPRERHDDAYFAPLSNLQLKPGMRLFLGLVHQFDGLEGARRRIAAARRYDPEFGVATECGMGRRKADDVPALLDLHHEVALILQ